MLEDAAMQTLGKFHDRDRSKPGDYRVVNTPMRGKKRQC